MGSSEKSMFEKPWKDALEEAEVPVSDAVWNSIDRKLTEQESGKMKRSVVYYQRIAAGAIFFSLLVGTYSVVNFSKESSLTSKEIPASNHDVTVELQKEQNSEIKSEAILSQDKNKTTRENLSSSQTKDSFQKQKSSVVTSNDQLIVEEDFSQPVLHDGEVNPQFQSKEALNPSERMLLKQFVFVEPSARVKGKIREVELFRQLPAISSSFMADSKKKDKNNEKLWASVGASTGSFNPNASRGGNAPTSSALGMAQSVNASSLGGTASSGIANSVGLTMGFKLSDRWIVQGGLSYFTQNYGQTSNLISLDGSNQAKVFATDYAASTNATLFTSSTSYKINGVNEVMSFPLQAGYLLVNKRVGLQLNAGLATDLFLRNTLSDQSGQLAKYSSTGGSESPYRSVSWSGLAGTEISYKFGNHYRISLVPGLRYSLQSVLKSQSGSISNPLIMDVGFRFRYIFK